MCADSLKGAFASVFLKQFKERMASCGLVFVPRKDNLDGIAQLGIHIRDAEAIILSLTDGECSKGPEPDRDGSPGDICTFLADDSGTEIYIKLKLEGELAKCLSFHPTRHPKRK